MGVELKGSARGTSANKQTKAELKAQQEQVGEQRVSKVAPALENLGYGVKVKSTGYTLYITKVNGKGEQVNKNLAYAGTIESLFNTILEREIREGDVFTTTEALVKLKKKVIQAIGTLGLDIC